tara:strand:+ start:2072 stop:2296 length:225 start_codon:yes stop_codon:yes gene_type:complete
MLKKMTSAEIEHVVRNLEKLANVLNDSYGVMGDTITAEIGGRKLQIAVFDPNDALCEFKSKLLSFNTLERRWAL